MKIKSEQASKMHRASTSRFAKETKGKWFRSRSRSSWIAKGETKSGHQFESQQLLQASSLPFSLSKRNFMQFYGLSDIVELNRILTFSKGWCVVILFRSKWQLEKVLFDWFPSMQCCCVAIPTNKHLNQAVYEDLLLELPSVWHSFNWSSNKSQSA